MDKNTDHDASLPRVIHVFHRGEMYEIHTAASKIEAVFVHDSSRPGASYPLDVCRLDREVFRKVQQKLTEES